MAKLIRYSCLTENSVNVRKISHRTSLYVCAPSEVRFTLEAAAFFMFDELLFVKATLTNLRLEGKYSCSYVI